MLYLHLQHSWFYRWHETTDVVSTPLQTQTLPDFDPWVGRLSCQRCRLDALSFWTYPISLADSLNWPLCGTGDCNQVPTAPHIPMINESKQPIFAIPPEEAGHLSGVQLKISCFWTLTSLSTSLMFKWMSIFICKETDGSLFNVQFKSQINHGIKLMQSWFYGRSNYSCWSKYLHMQGSSLSQGLVDNERNWKSWEHGKTRV